MPDYAVRNTATGEVRIVTAARPASALSHVVTPLFIVTQATAQDGIDAGRQGRRIEIAGEQADDAAAWAELNDRVTDQVIGRAALHGIGAAIVNADGALEPVDLYPIEGAASAWNSDGGDHAE